MNDFDLFIKILSDRVFVKIFTNIDLQLHQEVNWQLYSAITRPIKPVLDRLKDALNEK